MKKRVISQPPRGEQPSPTGENMFMHTHDPEGTHSNCVYIYKLVSPQPRASQLTQKFTNMITMHNNEVILHTCNNL